jgi:sporulation protein YlmC with PRC-barrel domain
MGGDAQAHCADRNTAEPEGTKKVAMAEATQFTIGVDASCTDGVCGEVSRVVIDPVAQAVTHLVVEPKHRQGLGRLVPVDLIDATPEEVKLRCTTAEFEQLDAAEETQFLPGSGGYAGYRPGQAFSWPFYGLGWGMSGNMAMGSVPQTVTYDTVPLGEVTVRRGEQVHATDGDIGRVQGLVINPRDHHVTHVLLQEGHLWGRKEVAIPIGAVTRVDDGIQLSMSKQDVQELPPVDIDHPNG